MTAVDHLSLAERLAGIVGPDQVASSPGLTVDGLPAPLAVTPATPDEVAAVLTTARQAGAAVTPWGGGTQQRLGPPPERLDLVLRTTRLTRIVEWEPDDLTACLEAGLTLAAAQQALAAQGQQIPIEAPCPDCATLGGLVATATAGPRRWLYGSWRDLVIGMRVALVDGSVIKSGGRVVKNVQGYDLAKLFTGSLGTLGVIVQVNVKLAPLPAARRLMAARGPLPAVATLLQEIAASTLRVATLDLLDEAAAYACGLDGPGAAGLVLLEGSSAVVDAHARTVAHDAAGHGLRCDAVDGPELDRVWRAWVDLARVDDLAPTEALLSIGTRPVAVGEVMEAIARAAEEHGLRARRWARAGSGPVYARLVAVDTGQAAGLAAAQATLLARWPAVTLVAGDPAIERAARPWGQEPEGLPLMRAIKQRFDPERTLQPGRFVGGI